MSEEAKKQIERGNRYPYDAIYDEATDENIAKEGDWAVKAARGVMCELTGRGGLDDVLYNIDDETKVEIVQAMAAIIREASRPEPGDLDLEKMEADFRDGRAVTPRNVRALMNEVRRQRNELYWLRQWNNKVLVAINEILNWREGFNLIECAKKLKQEADQWKEWQS